MLSESKTRKKNNKINTKYDSALKSEVPKKLKQRLLK